MAEENSNNQGEGNSGAPNSQNQNQNPQGNKPPVQKGDQGSENKPFDFSQIPDDQLPKILEDPRLFKLDRIKELRDSQKELKELREKQAKIEQEELEKKGEFEKLAKQREEENTNLKNQIKQSTIDNAILAEAGKQGITRLDLVNKLIDKTNIEINENNEVTGVENAVKNLIEANDFLKTNTNSSLGGGSNPSGNGEEGTFTITQIQDPIFYQKNKEAIQRAQAQGKIIEDRNY